MEIQQLRHLLAAADSRSYAQAAKSCNTSRQNIAHSIKMLEGELGPTLFERSGNEMILTESGRRVVQHARSIIARVDTLYDLYITPDEGDSILNIAVSPNLFAGMPNAIDAFFIERVDKFNLYEFDCQACCEAVCSGRMDVAIIMSMSRDFPNCNAMELAYSTAFALVPNYSPLRFKETIEVQDLLGQRLMVMSDPNWQYRPLFDQLDSLGFNHLDVATIPSTSTMLRILRGQGAIGLVSGEFAANPPHDTVAIPFADQEFNWHFYILYKQSSHKLQSILKLARGIGETFEG